MVVQSKVVRSGLVGQIMTGAPVDVALGEKVVVELVGGGIVVVGMVVELVVGGIMVVEVGVELEDGRIVVVERVVEDVKAVVETPWVEEVDETGLVEVEAIF